VRAEQTADGAVLELLNETWAEHGVRHLRRVVVSDVGVDVFDDITMEQDFALEARVHWLVPPGAALPEMTGTAGGTVTVVESAPDSTEGWWSPRYAERLPAVSVTFVTTLGREPTTIHSQFVATNLRG
jgi:hypothetical protein